MSAAMRVKLDFRKLEDSNVTDSITGKYWFSVNPEEISSIEQMSSIILSSFNITHCHSLALYSNGGLLRPQENITLLRDNDEIRVLAADPDKKKKKKRSKSKRHREETKCLMDMMEKSCEDGESGKMTECGGQVDGAEEDWVAVTWSDNQGQTRVVKGRADVLTDNENGDDQVEVPTTDIPLPPPSLEPEPEQPKSKKQKHKSKNDKKKSSKTSIENTEASKSTEQKQKSSVSSVVSLAPASAKRARSKSPTQDDRGHKREGQRSPPDHKRNRYQEQSAGVNNQSPSEPHLKIRRHWKSSDTSAERKTSLPTNYHNEHTRSIKISSPAVQNDWQKMNSSFHGFGSSRHLHESTDQDFVIYVNRHQSTKNKMTDWYLPNITQDYLVLGASNLSRITRAPIRNVQIESFPGALFKHIQKVVNEYNHSGHPKVIILGVGLNERLNHHFALYQSTQMVDSVRKCFPEACIYFPLHNYSENLPKDGQQGLDAINDHIEHLDRVIAIPKLPEDQFQTSFGDAIHWTQNTANALMRHWYEFVASDSNGHGDDTGGEKRHSAGSQRRRGNSQEDHRMASSSPSRSQSRETSWKNSQRKMSF